MSGRRLPPEDTDGTRLLAGTTILCALGLTAVAGLALLGNLSDYTSDAGPAVAALAAGSFRRAAAVPFLMGPFSIVLRAPFAWAAHRLGAGELGVYQAGIVPCLAVAGGLGVALARRSLGAGWSRSLPVVVSLLAVLSPTSLAAVRNGHPEEALGGALCVVAVLLATSRRHVAAGIALGLAVATKQWALLAVAPALLATVPKARARTAVVAALTAAVFYVPFVAQDTDAFMTATRIEAHVVPAATPQTVWLLAAHDRQVRLEGYPVLTYHATDKWMPPVSHALIILIGGLVGLALWRRPMSAAQPLAVLALLFLLRCVLDPVDMDYFHLPFLLALLAWEVNSGRLVRDLPVVTLGAAACLWLSFEVLQGVNPWLINAVYLTWTSAIALYLLASRRDGSILREPTQVPA